MVRHRSGAWHHVLVRTLAVALMCLAGWARSGAPARAGVRQPRPAFAPQPALACAASPAQALGATGAVSSTAYLPIVSNFYVVQQPWEAEVIALTNQQRTTHGCGPLAYSPLLTVAAQAHSRDMAVNDYFSHYSLDGRTPWDRIRATGYSYQRAAENIAAGYGSPASVVAGWMGSSGHRANILNCALTEIGVGYYYHSPDGGSVNYRHYWTQVFATPKD